MFRPARPLTELRNGDGDEHNQPQRVSSSFKTNMLAPIAFHVFVLCDDLPASFRLSARRSLNSPFCWSQFKIPRVARKRDTAKRCTSTNHRRQVAGFARGTAKLRAAASPGCRREQAQYRTHVCRLSKGILSCNHYSGNA
ncbi:hypothetical protein M408DRAFT_112806 [Serendipita vermifera MAFF 305830]|uniref:Uncharacterized protein n=1 Tax=Serendipita vermifera MAFF 305830 TaxID=933852 RepID=A0A0C3AXY6_SERVB|nr:hypothetical protein M408DRAFT_112806 [Serendipita vermifera MAFF 305830]